MSTKKLYKLCITIVLLITITFGFYIFFSTSEDISLTSRVLQPYAHIKCKLAGGNFVRQGFVGRYCKHIYSDVNKSCFSNKDCKSTKCVVGTGWVLDPIIEQRLEKIETSRGPTLVTKQLPNDISGKCSDDNTATCFSGELTIGDDRTLNRPPICD